MIFLSFPAAAFADDGEGDCTRGEVDCEYPGLCRAYVDSNGDNICDHSQIVEQQEIQAVSQIEANKTVQVAASVLEKVDVPEKSNSPQGNKLSYYLLPILLSVTILYGISYFMSARGVIRQVIHRKIWNMFLLITTVVSALLGLVLVLRVDFNVNITLPFDVLFWHVETGIAMGLIAVFHMLWHWRYFQKMFKPAG